MQKFLSRKFILCVLIVLSATGLVYLKSIGETSYTTVIGTVVAAYVAGNVTQKVLADKKP